MTLINAHYSESNNPYFLEDKKRELCKKTACVAAGIFLFSITASAVVHHFFPYSKAFFATAGVTSLCTLTAISLVAIRNCKKWNGYKKTFQKKRDFTFFECGQFEKVCKIQYPERVKHLALSTSNKERASFEYPHDTLRIVFRMLTMQEFGRLSQTCKCINQFFKTDKLFWKNLLERDFGIQRSVDLDNRREYRLLISYRQEIYDQYRRTFKKEDDVPYYFFKERILFKKLDTIQRPDGLPIKPKREKAWFLNYHATDSFLFMGRDNWVEVYDASYQFRFELVFPGYEEAKSIQLPDPVMNGGYIISYDHDKLLRPFCFNFDRIYETAKNLIAVSSRIVLIYDKETGILQEQRAFESEILNVHLFEEELYLSIKGKGIEMYQLNPSFTHKWTLANTSLNLRDMVKVDGKTYLIATTTLHKKTTVSAWSEEDLKNPLFLLLPHCLIEALVVNENYICMGLDNGILQIYKMGEEKALKSIGLFKYYTSKMLLYQDFLIAASGSCIKIVDLRNAGRAYTLREYTEDYPNISEIKVMGGKLFVSVHHSAEKPWSEIEVFDFGKLG